MYIYVIYLTISFLLHRFLAGNTEQVMKESWVIHISNYSSNDTIS